MPDEYSQESGTLGSSDQTFEQTADMLDNIDFGELDLPADFFTFANDIPTEETVPQTQGFSQSMPGVPQSTTPPQASKYEAEVPQDFIDPSLLNGPQATTDATSPELKFEPNQHPANNFSSAADPYVTTGFPPATTGYAAVPTPTSAPASIPYPQYPPQNPQWAQYPPQQFQQPFPQYPLPQQSPLQYPLQLPQQYPQQYAQMLPPQYAQQPPYPFPQQYPQPYFPQPMNPIPQSQQPHPDDRRYSLDSSVVKGFSAVRRYRNPISRIPSPIIVYHDSPLKRPKFGADGEPLKSGRIPRVTRKNQERPNPREWYGPSPPKPESWGPKGRDGRPIFRYTDQGELERGKSFGTKEMRQYIYGPKPDETFDPPRLLEGTPEISNKNRQGLTLWIGWVAAQSNDRYPFDTLSQKCRFSNCPDPKNTIRSGLPRVIFDERYNADGEAVDVFHNAGYAHLYCLEKNFDLIGTMQVVNVCFDYRDFKREENLCKLSRQFPEIQDDIEDWYRVQYEKHKKLPAGQSREWNYKETLSYCLVKHSIENIPEIRARVRESRAGADISKHMGDIEKQTFLINCRQYNLLDQHGDPIPNAWQELQRLKKNGRKNRLPRPIVKTERDGSYSPTMSYSGTPYGSTPGSYLSHPVTPASGRFTNGYPAMLMSPAPAPYPWPVQPQPGYPYQQQMPQPFVEIPQVSSQKRARDEVEDDDVEIVGENPAKKPRFEQTNKTETIGSIDQFQAAEETEMPMPMPMPMPNLDGYDDFKPLDNDAGLDIIENEMSSQSQAGTLDEVSVKGENLFGDDDKEPAPE